MTGSSSVPSRSDGSLHPVHAYALAVASGEIVAGSLVRLACERHLRDLATGHKRGLRFDEEAADHALTFFRFTKHSKGEWAGRVFELALWQIFIVGCLFGWQRQIDGVWLRRFRTAYLSVARKNGKTQLAAGIGLYLAFFDGEPGAEVYSAATTEAQARICWSEAKRMVLKSPKLKARVTALANNLHRELTAQKFEPLANDPTLLDGLSCHGAVIDEYHAHPSGELADVLESSTGARRQPLMVYTTTAGSNAGGACATLDRDMQHILAGEAEDDAVFAYIARIDEGDAWNDRRAWAKANPNLGISVKPDDLERKAQRAERIPREQNEFRRKHCNQWTEQATRWLNMEDWERIDAAVDADLLAGQECFAGLDLSSTTDLTAFVAAFPDGEGGLDLLCKFWMPDDSITPERDKTDRATYREWVDAGWITATEGNIADYDVIRDDISAFATRYQVTEIPYDKWNATQLATQLMQDGATMVPVPQNYAALSEPSKLLEALILSGRLRHGGNPVLTWMARNVAVATGPNGSIRPVKDKSTGRIDGIVALVMAIARWVAHQSGDDHSVYENRGVRRL